MVEALSTVISRAPLGDWLLLAAGFLLVLYVVGNWNFDHFQKRGIPSTKPTFPFWGDFAPLLLGQRSLHDVVHDVYKRGEGHGVFGSFELNNPVLMIREPELLKVVCVKEFDSFVNHRSFASEKVDPIFGKNLINLKDQTWKDMRGTLSPAFTTSKIKAMLPLMAQCAQQLTEYLREKYDSSEEGSMKKPLVLDMKEIFSRMTNDIIATTAFGVSCDSLKHPNNEFFTKGKQLTTFGALQSAVFFAYIVLPKLMEKTGIRILNTEATAFFRALVHGTIREREQRGIARPDVLQLLMQARHGKLTADKADAAEAEDLGGSAKQLLRMYPPNATTDRVCQKDTILPATSTSKAIAVTKGTILHLPIIGLHMDSQYWNEPETFDPERFNDENKHKIKPNTYVPFGVGPRICIGSAICFNRNKSGASPPVERV